MGKLLLSAVMNRSFWRSMLPFLALYRTCNLPFIPNEGLVQNLKWRPSMRSFLKRIPRVAIKRIKKLNGLIGDGFLFHSVFWA